MSDSRFQRVLRAWHASPHEFDEFQDPEVVKGKGQGAAVYGAGIYVAENPKVSGPGQSEYMREFERHPLLKSRSGTGEEMLGDLPLQRLHESLRDKRGFAYGDARNFVAKLFKVAPRHGSIDYLREALNVYFGDSDQKEMANNDFRNLVDHHKSMHEETLEEDDPDYKQDLFDMNHMHKNVIQHYRRAASPTSYELAMTLEPHELLDWDKHGAEQPDIVDKARATIEKPKKFEIRKNSDTGGGWTHAHTSTNATWNVHNAETGAIFDGGHGSESNAKEALQRAQDMSDREYASIFLGDDAHLMPGSQLYQTLQQHHGSDIATSKALLKQGVKGIKYLDGGSRNSTVHDVSLKGGPRDEEESSKLALVKLYADAIGNTSDRPSTFDDVLDHYQALASNPSVKNAEAAHAEEMCDWLMTNVGRINIQAAPKTHNYVIFDPKVIKILAKYDIKGEKLAEMPEGRLFRQVDHDPFEQK